MTPDLPALRSLLAAATADEWVAEGVKHQDGLDEPYWDVDGENGGWVCHAQDEETAALIAAAVTALPDLLDRMERAEAQVAAVEALVGDGSEKPEMRMAVHEVVPVWTVTLADVHAALNPTKEN